MKKVLFSFFVILIITTTTTFAQKSKQVTIAERHISLVFRDYVPSIVLDGTTRDTITSPSDCEAVEYDSNGSIINRVPHRLKIGEVVYTFNGKPYISVTDGLFLVPALSAKELKAKLAEESKLHQQNEEAMRQAKKAEAKRQKAAQRASRPRATDEQKAALLTNVIRTASTIIGARNGMLGGGMQPVFGQASASDSFRGLSDY